MTGRARTVTKLAVGAMPAMATAPMAVGFPASLPLPGLDSLNGDGVGDIEVLRAGFSDMAALTPRDFIR